MRLVAIDQINPLPGDAQVSAMISQLMLDPRGKGALDGPARIGHDELRYDLAKLLLVIRAQQTHIANDPAGSRRRQLRVNLGMSQALETGRHRRFVIEK